MHSTNNTVVRRIRAKGRGWVFTPKDFLDVGSRAAVDQSLSRLLHKGVIRRLGHGIYDFPKTNPSIGVLSPSPDSLARAIATQTGDSIQPSGARAANWLGLSTQVPAKPVYLTSGPSKKKNVGGRLIVFRHTSIPSTSGKTDKANMVVQAILHLGKTHIDDAIIHRCARQLSSKDKQLLGKMVTKVPSWMVPVIHQIQAD